MLEEFPSAKHWEKINRNPEPAWLLCCRKLPVHPSLLTAPAWLSAVQMMLSIAPLCAPTATVSFLPPQHCPLLLYMGLGALLSAVGSTPVLWGGSATQFLGQNPLWS